MVKHVNYKSTPKHQQEKAPYLYEHTLQIGEDGRKTLTNFHGWFNYRECVVDT